MLLREDQEVLTTRIERLYRARCGHLDVSVFELPIVFRIGLIVAMCGGTDEQVGDCMRDACAVARTGAPA